MNGLPSNIKKEQAILLKVHGRVQGVGFRPFVYRLAREKKLLGEVFNQPDGVIIHIQGPASTCSEFSGELLKNAPSASIIKEILAQEVPLRDFHDFQIRSSSDSEKIIAEVCPDISICDDCLRELQSPDRRKGYPFINCTNCGPRFTIIEDFPYDRQHTSMDEFNMCPLCQKEYEDPENRRFHAQPTSCFDCGPEYLLHTKEGMVEDISLITDRLAKEIDAGKVSALKGLGGYNIACDAFNEAAVAELRTFKKRERKPFAVMFRSATALKNTMNISKKEEENLCSWRRPIVILNGKQKKRLAPGITAGLESLGAFLPYLPLHHLLFEKLKTDAVVLTSGNESDTPILYQDDKALETFSGLSGSILTNNRRIARRADDSVIRIIMGEEMIMRRSRGYSPAPVDLHFNAEGILATGAELSNAFCMGSGRQAIFSQHIGDLKNFETYDFFRENIDRFSHIYRFKPVLAAIDMHPDYLSTQYARESGLPCVAVQHHHAHIASVMAEYGLKEPVIGLAYDGTGFGTDGHTWGSEAMIADYQDFKRISHFEYFPMPGGDSVTKEPWRTGLSYLIGAYPKSWKDAEIPILRNIDLLKAERIIEAIDKKINCPMSCSAGRLFDAVAALTGICTESNYHAEAPQLMENYLTDYDVDPYPFEKGEVISFLPMIREIVSNLNEGISLEIIISRFHTSIAEAALTQVELASKQLRTEKVVLSGGSFQNRYLCEKLVHLLKEKNYTVYLPREISCNDGGIALGQLAVAAHKNRK